MNQPITLPAKETERISGAFQILSEAPLKLLEVILEKF